MADVAAVTPGIEPGTLRLQARRSNHWAILLSTLKKIETFLLTIEGQMDSALTSYSPEWLEIPLDQILYLDEQIVSERLFDSRLVKVTGTVKDLLSLCQTLTPDSKGIVHS